MLFSRVETSSEEEDEVEDIKIEIKSVDLNISNLGRPDEPRSHNGSPVGTSLDAKIALLDVDTVSESETSDESDGEDISIKLIQPAFKREHSTKSLKSASSIESLVETRKKVKLNCIGTTQQGILFVENIETVLDARNQLIESENQRNQNELTQIQGILDGNLKKVNGFIQKLHKSNNIIASSMEM
ncbi:hypothetical protein PCE1_004288 [Barthelona sp. PCE]